MIFYFILFYLRNGFNNKLTILLETLIVYTPENLSEV